MARLNTYTRTSQPSDSDVFVIDSTTGSAGTRTVLWSSIRSLFAAAKHSHAASDITSGTLAVDRLPTIPLSKGGTGATSAATARTALGVQNPITAANALTNQNLNSYNSVEQCGWYYAADGNSVTNKPLGVDHFGMFVMQTASGMFTQILYDNSNKIWTRSYSNSAWSTWTALVRYVDAANASQSGIMASSDWALLHSLKTIDRPEAIPANADLDNYKTPGWYALDRGNSLTIKNKPVSGETIGMIQVMQINTNERIQVYITAYQAENRSGRKSMFIRYFGGGGGTSWSPWTDITAYPSATQSADGLMSSADKRKLDGLSGDYASAIGLATSSKDGLMSKTDKAKLDAIGSISNSTIDGFFRI